MVGVVRKIEMTCDWFGRICVVSFCVSWVFAEAVRQSPPCFAYVDFLAKRAGYAIDDICRDAGEKYIKIVLFRYIIHIFFKGQSIIFLCFYSV